MHPSLIFCLIIKQSLGMDHYVFCFLVFGFSHLLFIHSFVNAKIHHGFTIDLIHRNSKFSPFYNKSATPEELLTNSALRSYSRVNRFHQSSTTIDEEKIESVVIPNGGDYLMKISIGSPPIESYAIADTGSDLVWFQCAPCDQCYKQDSPLFNPTASKTYLELACDASPCQALPKSTCGRTSNECQYTYSYGDDSYTIGTLATETFTFDSTTGQPQSFPNSIFGCGHQNNGLFNSRGSGLVGLGGGPLSLVSQLSDQIQRTFSYCLVPITAGTNSKLRFGKDAVISSESGVVVSTPLLSKASKKTFYYLNLEGASVGGKKVINKETSRSEGNIIIDSGTTLTFLESGFYNELEAIVKESIVGLSPVQDPKGRFNLCYNELPDMQIVFHFTGADVTLKTVNIFRQADDNLVCMTIVPTTSSTRIFGNLAQINFQVEYDLANKLVSFAPADCSQF